MTCAENPPPSLLKQDGLCTQGLYCRNQSWEIETGGGVCENVSASWFDTLKKKGWKKLPLDWKMEMLNIGSSFWMCTLTHAWVLWEDQIRKPELKKPMLPECAASQIMEALMWAGWKQLLAVANQIWCHAASEIKMFFRGTKTPWMCF